MGVIVQKYGGTSIATPTLIKSVANRIVATRQAGHEVVVVVSAMGGHTDELVGLSREISPNPSPRELDMLMTAGERISMALLCMALIDRGFDAVSFTGSQAGIVTDAAHGKARILDIKATRIRASLESNKIAVVAGFQGVAPTSSDVTTLGRGGSDTTAVALAASLKADACEIYTDVDGIYTADPRRVATARKLSRVNYEEMLELAASGAKVLHVRAVEFARNYQVPVHVRSSFSQEQGTWVVQEDKSVEQAIIRGVAHDASEAKITLQRVPNRPSMAAKIFRALSDATINIDMIVQNVSSAGSTDVSFTVPESDLVQAESVISDVCREIDAPGYDVDPNIAKISIIGAGMKTHPGTAATMFEALGDKGINIEMISTSNIRISCIIASKDLDAALNAVHDQFALGTLGDTSLASGETLSEVSEGQLSRPSQDPASKKADKRGE